MKNKFWTGLLVGMLGTLLVGTVAFSTYFIKSGAIYNQQSEEIQTDEKLTESVEVKKKIDTIQGLIDQYYIDKVKEDTLADGLYQGLMYSLGDPYAAYYTKEDFASLIEATNGVYCGIGATVSQDAKTGIITIVKPFVGAPAYKAGILPGDVIYKVDGNEVTGVDLTEVVSKMKGKEGTDVVITIVREGELDPMDFTVKRKQVEVPTIESEMLSGKIGYISVSEFDEITSAQFINAVDTLEKQGEKGLIIDLRNNGGGLYDTAVAMLERMLPKGLLVYQEDKNGNKQEDYAKKEDEFNKPLVILVNENTASASEIFAGAIQDYEKGTIVGTKTFGKGIVQSVIPLYDDSAVKLTVAKYFTPKGRNIHGIGIEPDVSVELDEKLRQKPLIKKEEDNQLQKAIQVIKQMDK
ncbi:carboxyl-terminal processing protease [Mobilisporobacter senegalensis]|uniref:Carboxyl-terminal processing protease n=1 Tax=Mobilisporobacter senegalensis TaxID=1329262 RepID=A0A3N1XZH1_9FIRM|nr:S41 family peptidase [Mobilisporobacter senegalensis]ROR31641.1 carboxyl-terminal processing protease [Mobilisporobacter senegalensis]